VVFCKPIHQPRERRFRLNILATSDLAPSTPHLINVSPMSGKSRAGRDAGEKMRARPLCLRPTTCGRARKYAIARSRTAQSTKG